MAIERFERKPIVAGSVLRQVSFTDNEKSSVFDAEYFVEGNTYRRDLTILGPHAKNINSKSVSTGSTCLVYDGRLGDLDVIVKEFYPETDTGFFYMERAKEESQELKVHYITNNENSEFADRKRKFLLGYHEQKEYIKKNDLKEVLTLPLGLGRYGDSYYIVNPVNHGITLDAIQKWSGIEEKIRVLVHLADVLKILEKNKILFLDLSPENLLYINVSDTVQQIKLFDVDSFIDLEHVGEVSELMYNKDYVWPEIVNHLVDGRSFNRQKSYYLIPYAAVYSFGMIACEILFGHRPSAEELEFSEETMEAMLDSLMDQDMDQDLAGALVKLLKLAMTDYHSSAEFIYGSLNEIYKKMQSKKYQVQKKADENNYLHFAYDMLQKYPLFDFAEKLKNAETKETGYHMEVALIGSHPMRKYVLKALLSCGQMLNSKLVIRLVSENAGEFWKQYSSEEENPEIANAVNVYGTGLETKHDPKCVSGELADIYLHEYDDGQKILTLLKECKSRYIMVLEERADAKKELIEGITKLRHGKKKVFVGYLGKKNDVCSMPENWSVCPINGQQVLMGYQENSERKSKIYQMGLQIHYHYERMRKPRASVKEIERESYAGNSYNRSSSERAALHMIYKLASIGITDLEAEDLMDQLKKKLYANTPEAQKNFDRLVWLEHKSWSAYMMCSGWRKLPVMEYEDFMYEGSNTWKDNVNKRHPHIVSSTAERPLRKMLMREASRTKKKLNLDELDKASVWMYDILTKKAQTRKPIIDAGLKELDLLVERDIKSQFEEDFTWVRNAIEDCYSVTPKSNVRLNWQRAINSLVETVQVVEFKTESSRNRMLSRINDIKNLMIPILESLSRGDVKESDEDVIRAIPHVLSQSKGFGKLTVIRPMTDKKWENVFGTLSIRPQVLILVGSGTEKPDVEEYQKILKHFGLEDVAVKAETADKFMKKELNGLQLLDMTGLESFEVYRWLHSKIAKNSWLFDADQLKIRGWNNKNVELLPFDLHLTVQETLELTGGLAHSEKHMNASTMLTVAQEKALWKGYAKNRGLYWNIFINTLNTSLKKNKYEIPLTKGNTIQYTTGYIYNQALDDSGYRQILKKCALNGWITNVAYPSKYDQGAQIQFRTEYPALGQVLRDLGTELCMDGVNSLEYRFAMDFWDENMVRIQNKTLVCRMEVPHNSVPGTLRPVCYDDIAVKCLNALNSGGPSNALLQNLRISDLGDKSGKKISFVFASDAVRDALKTEGSVLEILIYYECLSAGIFDDVRMNSYFKWGSTEVQNEIDVIGVKNNRSYFISAKMGAAKREFMEEIAQVTQKFALSGHPILISSSKSAKAETESTTLMKRGEMMGVRYIGADQIFNEDDELILAETIRKIVEEAEQA